MKKAFTFAEVLIVLMIIGILIALCMGAGQVSLRNAYNLYFYRTYSALTTAFDNYLYMKKHEETVQEVDPETGQIVSKIKGKPDMASPFQSHFYELINDDYRIGTEDTTAFQATNVAGDPFWDYGIVTIPTVKTKDNEEGNMYYKVVFHCGYLKQAYEDKEQGDLSGYGPLMIIIGSSTSQDGPFSLSPDEAKINVVDNVEVLPAYADNGTIGRLMAAEEGATQPKYEPVFPRTYREALCATWNPEDDNSILNHPTAQFSISTYCSGVAGTSAERFKDGTVKLIPPRNLR